MAKELAYVLITPYTIRKSRTGGIISRLISKLDLDFVGARMFAPSEEFVVEYVEQIRLTAKKGDDEIIELLCDYVKEHFAPHEKMHRRVMILLFKGENARKKVYDTVGSLKPGLRTGTSIRDTYSDYVLTHDGNVHYFEPAVIASSTSNGMENKLKLFAKYLRSEENIIDKELMSGENSDKRTLTIIKPDNWRYPSSRPGNIIDMLSSTGLRIIGCKLYHMSVEEALEFYGPVKGVLREKLSENIGLRAKNVLEREFNIKLNDPDINLLTKRVGIDYADDQFAKIVEFMCGIRPDECPEEDIPKPGKVKCLILIYQGENAVDKIRNVLGPTDPTKAPWGTVRRDFGTDVMVNTAHASDSYENAQREMRIVKIERNDFTKVIDEFYKK